MSRRGLRGIVMLAGGTVRLAKLLGASGSVELMALAGNTNQGNGHKKHGE
jgi:hypothetical protein